jgi:zinc/manganese transport system substrate-binding protein
MSPVKITRVVAAATVALALSGALAGCSQSADASSSSGKIVAVGAENEYANVISQIGGKYVTATAIMSNPNTDPHTFEASASVAKEVSAARLIVQNGVGYDDFMTKIEASSPNSSRKVIVAQKVLGLPDSTPNPHLWYKPTTMPAVAKAIASDLASLQPSHKAYFEANLTKFVNSLTPWENQLAAFKKAHPGLAVAVTEPVADYMLQAAGTDIKTPWTLQAAIMNNTDPSPQDSATQDALFNDKQVKVFLYNQQVTDSVTAHFLSVAKANHIPVVGVYETMPTPGYDYQSWMVAELNALTKAVTDGTSTQKL